MMRITLVLLSVLLLQLGRTEEHLEQKSQHPEIPPRRNTKEESLSDALDPEGGIRKPSEEHLEQKSQHPEIPRRHNTKEESLSDALDPEGGIRKPSVKPEALPSSLLSQDCVSEKHTRLSCAKVFCPPWLRCINGKCVCKLPYQCPRIGPPVCGLDGTDFLSLCHAQASACQSKKPVFSHYSRLGACEEDSFDMQLKVLRNQKQVVPMFTAIKENFLVCGSDSWNMAAANVVCRHKKNEPRGALALGTTMLKDIAGRRVLSGFRKCISVRCTGAERTLAECVLYAPLTTNDNTSVATVTCYDKEQGMDKCDEFRCVNEKCVSWEHICDGVDDCGDNSDEMCCTGCQKGAFFCKTGVCLPPYSVGDKIRDCLGGEDELETSSHIPEIQPRSDRVIKVSKSAVKPDTGIWSDPTQDILRARNHTETLQCGIPNMDYLHKTEEETRYRRTKRVVGGEEALPTQIQWQVAVQEEGKIHCGGAYLGGCWVLTAAHCVRQKPQVFRIKFSLWKKLSLLSTTDSVPVKNIIIHRDYNPRTYENDIALIQLEELANVKECLYPNPAVRSVCVPWSTLQFPPNYTCTISGWGRNKQGESVDILKWANVSLIPHCKSYYKERFYPGMMCAGDLEGNVDSCQGDSGGPLVCKDASGVSYVWGIVSWGEKCGEAGYPGVYTKVAHYFEWIRQHTGWPAVTKYNQ